MVTHDKHDLLRNAVPGYVFLIVILSFYAIDNRLDSISSYSLIGVVAGFPIGFIFAVLYRSICHILSREQAGMELADKKIIELKFKETFKKIMKEYPDINKNRVASNSLTYFLSRNDNNPFKERLDYLITYVHALGASCFAIISALFFIVCFKFRYWSTCPFMEAFILRNWFLVLLWLFIIGAFFLGRNAAMKSYLEARRLAVDNILYTEMKQRLE
jgi:hypothetical protein